MKRSLAAIKLRSWTGEKGIYAKLFDAQTTMRLDSNWLFFNVEGLSSDPRLETAMSMLIANAVAARAGGRTGQPSITVLDECWSLLDSPTLAPEVVQLFRTARKRNGSVWGISQTVEDFVGTEFQPREHGAGNSEERDHEDHWATARRYDRSGKPPVPESGGPRPSEAVQRPAERPERG